MLYKVYEVFFKVFKFFDNTLKHEIHKIYLHLTLNFLLILHSLDL